MSLKPASGAIYLGEGKCQFRVWAPFLQKVEVHIVAPQERLLPLDKDAHGYHQATVADMPTGSLYYYRLNGENEYPDPASRFQPQGVHGPSQVVERTFPWKDDNWHGLNLADYIIYELHVGTFTEQGTFNAVIPHLDRLKELGITAVELMPVAQFPGNRNWGYDGVYPFAVQNSYGGPDALRQMVNACHQQGLAVILDVVYNHLGPEGNYLRDFGPYFTDRYHTPWGEALNFDGPHSDEVRRYFIENALYWLTEFHIDAIRLDALHAILDISPFTFIEELATVVHEELRQLDRKAYLIGESAANDVRLIRSRALGGYALDAQWNDDFHHALHVLLTGEKTGYYQDFGNLEHLAKAFREGFVYSGEYSPYRNRRHGTSSRDISAHRMVVFSQNHDQVGNRLLGERPSRTVSFEALKLAAGTVLLSPFIPLLFMGEEYGETAPFPYFISHSESALVEAVRRGRREEFAAFNWLGELSDPQDEATFQCAKIDHQLRHEGHHRVILEFYRELIRLRKENPVLSKLSKKSQEVSGDEENKVMMVHRWNGDDEVFMVFNFGDDRISAPLSFPAGNWSKLFDSAEERWQGGGSTVGQHICSKGKATIPLSSEAFALFVRTEEI